ncbi:hypothetical protein JW905_09700, partial [bacterium]|nr:hypothetical protein [candidate division CSSED10-310 bacterium]
MVRCRWLRMVSWCLVAAVLSGGGVFGAWSDDPAVNMTVTDADQHQYENHVVATEDGGYVVVWTTVNPVKGTQREGDGTYLQKYNADGDRVWGNTGVELVSGLESHTYPRLCNDGAGGIIAGWNQYHESMNDIRVQRWTAAGTPLWTVGGVLVSEPGIYSYGVRVASDGLGGVYAVFRANEPAGRGYQLVVQHVTAVGTLDWTGPVVLTSTASYDYEVAPDGIGGLLVVWTDERGGQSIYAQRVTVGGAVLWQAGGLLLAEDEGYRWAPKVTDDGDEGGYFAWIDYRFENSFVYMQRVLSTGAPAWQVNGLRIDEGTHDKQHVDLVHDEAGGVITAYMSYYDQVIQAARLAPDGTQVWGGPIEVTPTGIVTGLSHYPGHLVQDGFGGAIVGYLRYPDGPKNGEAACAQRITAAGGLPWGIAGVSLCPDNLPGGRSDVRGAACAAAGEGGAVFSWSCDRRDGEYDRVYLMGVNAMGELGAPCSESDISTTWPTDPGDNLPVSDIIQRQYSNRIISVPDGGYIVTWTTNDPVKGSEGIFAQKFDASGNKRWGSSGVSVGTTTMTATGPRICHDGDNGVVIAWIDRRNLDNEVYVQHIDSDGSPDWTAGGVQVCSNPGSDAYCHNIAEDGAGGAYIVWRWYAPVRNDGGRYLQHVGSDGTVLWTAPVQVDPQSDGPAKVAPDGAGGALVVWVTYHGSYSTIDAQRFSSAGAKHWGTDISITASQVTSYCPQLAEDGSGGWYITWRENAEGTWRCYLQRLLPNGTVAWQTDGISVSDDADETYDAGIVSDTTGGAILAFHSQTDDIMYATRIDGAGIEVWGGIVPITEFGFVYNFTKGPGQLVPDGFGGAIVAFTAYGDAKDSEYIVCQRVSSEGEAAWGASGVAVCDEDLPSWRGCARMAPCPANGQGGAVVCWRDYRDSQNSRIYTMALDAWGNLGTPCSDLSTTWSTDPTVNLPVSITAGEQQSHRIIAVDDGGYIVTWIQYEAVRTGPMVMAQKFSAAGNREWGHKGVVVCEAGSEQYSPRLCTDGAGGAIITLSDYRDEYPRIFAQRLDANGIPQWGTGGVPLSPEEEEAYCPFCDTDGAGGAYVVFQAESGCYCQRITAAGAAAWLNPVQLNDQQGYPIHVAADGIGGAILGWTYYNDGVTYSDVYAQRIIADGSVTWGAGGVVVCDAEYDQDCPRVIADNSGGGVFLWADNRGGNGAVAMQRVTFSGVPSWTANGVILDSQPNYVRSHAFASDGTGGGIAVWTCGNSSHLYAGRVDGSGVITWGSPVQLTDSELGWFEVAESPVTTVSDSSGGAISVFASYDPVKRPPYVHAQRVSAAGTLPWGMNGIILCDNLGDHECVRVAPCATDDGGALACWRDYRDDNAALYVMGVDLEGDLGDPCGLSITPTPFISPTPSLAPTQTPA